MFYSYDYFYIRITFFLSLFSRYNSLFPGETVELVMIATVYLEGYVAPDGQHIVLPLSSFAVLLIISYAEPSTFHLVFVQTHVANAEQPSSYYVVVPRTGKHVY